MDELTAPSGQASAFARLLRGYRQLSVRRIATIKVEDMALAGGYFAIFWLLEAVDIAGTGTLRVQAFASAWAAFALLGCVGVLLRRVSPAAMGWMCGVAVVGMALAGNAGAFVLAFEFFFSLVLFATPRASHVAARASWVLTVLLVLAAFLVSRSAATAIAAAVIAVVTLLTPVEWAGNLRKANLLTLSESARADALQDAAEQRLLAQRSAHDLALERERQHMARELHDVVSARLSAIALQSGAALHASALSPAVPATTTILNQIRDESVAGLQELNAMIRLLHTGALAEAGGRLSDLPGLLRQYRSAGMELQYANSLDDAGEQLSLPLQTALYRILSEAVANAAKHAPGQEVDVVLGYGQVPFVRSGNPEHSPGIVLTVTNHLPVDAHTAPASRVHVRASMPPMPPVPPSSADPGTGTGTGIPSMQFRAAHVGGALTAGPDHSATPNLTAGSTAGLWKVALLLPLAKLPVDTLLAANESAEGQA
ncbi:sensor histidine kinase [Arthrobacter sp.]|uniref:sensor histidine kinase n=1 Tax=Arthrobacter sp. TaxID=1667 RepID=UPI0026E0589A|nr:histidine kinase [Arthrobacter sp.]MDO5754099.1 histidine kinase [Arthrobacter sp.]